MTEFATELRKESQSLRGVVNYLSDTFDGIEGHEFDFGKLEFKERHEFFEAVSGYCSEWARILKNSK